MLIFFEAIHLYILLAILVIVLIYLRIQGRRLFHLFFCAVFGIYLIGVVSVVIFPIHIPQNDMALGRELPLNFVPFDFGRCDFLSLCIRNIYENILLTMPFGFGISFITKIKSHHITWLAVTVGLIFEVTQLMISLAIGSLFRVVDINDVILNAIGVLFGYSLFRIFGWLFLFVTQKFGVSDKHIFAYVYEVYNIAEN